MKKHCLNCRLFGMVDSTSGRCRAGGLPRQDRPVVHPDHSCDAWEDSGQQYYIRLGWIKGQKRRREQTA